MSSGPDSQPDADSTQRSRPPELILLRHGQSELNAKGALAGRCESALTPLGVEQATAAARSLAEELGSTGSIRLVTSPLRRTRLTAEIVVRELSQAGCDVSEAAFEDRLIELDYGDLDGVALKDVSADDWERWRADPGYRPPNGETLLELQARCEAFFDELQADSVGGSSAAASVVAVTHVSPIKAAVAWALGTGPAISWRLHLPVASVTRVRLGRRGPQLVSFGETGHMKTLSLRAGP